MSLLRRRMMMAKKPSGGGGIFPLALITGAQDQSTIDSLLEYVKANGETLSVGSAYALRLESGDLTITHKGVTYPIPYLTWNEVAEFTFFMEEGNYMTYFDCFNYTLSYIDND